MMIKEFTERTGYEPGMEEYRLIEQRYVEDDVHKDDFCKAWKEDFEDGHWARELKLRKALEEQKDAFEQINADLGSAILHLEEQAKDLQTRLEKELEWQPYEDDHNVKQADYDVLAGAFGTRELTDDEAVDMIANEFGFDRSRISIVHELNTYEINRHRRLRKSGTVQRKALFNAWDWNYIVFNVRGNCTMGYEMHNGSLQMYCC